MNSIVSQNRASHWLLEHGPQELESLLRTIVHDPAAAKQDCALSLLDVEGNVAAWYAGAELVFGYAGVEVDGEHVSLFDLDEDAFRKVNDR